MFVGFINFHLRLTIIIIRRRLLGSRVHSLHFFSSQSHHSCLGLFEEYLVFRAIRVCVQLLFCLY